MKDKLLTLNDLKNDMINDNYQLMSAALTNIITDKFKDYDQC